MFLPRTARTPRQASFALAVVAALALALLVGPAGRARAATDVLPDLGMAQLKDFRIDKTADGRRLLRFSSIVVNVGAGAFEVHGSRDASTPTMTVQQRIFLDDGTYRDVPTGATAYFAGDGHNHWHVTDLEQFTLVRSDNGVKVGTGAKHGFCFYDTYPYGNSAPAFYTHTGGACGSSASDLSVVMGLSVRWGDIYSYYLPDQWIDVTGLTSGRYRLNAAADAQNWFTESNESNNATWADLQLQGNSVKVVAMGPGA